MTLAPSNLNPYHQSLTKKLLDLSFVLITTPFLIPVCILIGLIIKLTSNGPIFFTQLRVGKDQKPIKFYKFRTMKLGSEKLQKKLNHLNQVDGPVFKIRNDPRFTKFGQVLSKSGLDELPQLINVLLGNMSLVGPRPLPVYEAKKLNSSQNKRHLIKPGITSMWATLGPHSISFDQWMKLDLNYVTNATLVIDLSIILNTILYLLKLTFRRFTPIIFSHR